MFVVDAAPAPMLTHASRKRCLSRRSVCIVTFSFIIVLDDIVSRYLTQRFSM